MSSSPRRGPKKKTIARATGEFQIIRNPFYFDALGSRKIRGGTDGLDPDEETFVGLSAGPFSEFVEAEVVGDMDARGSPGVPLHRRLGRSRAQELAKKK
jgi:hypothetical protein